MKPKMLSFVCLFTEGLIKNLTENIASLFTINTLLLDKCLMFFQKCCLVYQISNNLNYFCKVMISNLTIGLCDLNFELILISYRRMNIESDML